MRFNNYLEIYFPWKQKHLDFFISIIEILNKQIPSKREASLFFDVEICLNKLSRRMEKRIVRYFRKLVDFGVSLLCPLDCCREEYRRGRREGRVQLRSALEGSLFNGFSEMLLRNEALAKKPLEWEPF